MRGDSAFPSMPWHAAQLTETTRGARQSTAQAGVATVPAATARTAITLGSGYIFANTFEGLDLEASPVCVSDMSPRTTNNTWTSPYLNCPTGLVYSRDTTTFGQIRWQLGAGVQTPYIQH